MWVSDSALPQSRVFPSTIRASGWGQRHKHGAIRVHHGHVCVCVCVCDHSWKTPRVLKGVRPHLALPGVFLLTKQSTDSPTRPDAAASMLLSPEKMPVTSCWGPGERAALLTGLLARAWRATRPGTFLSCFSFRVASLLVGAYCSPVENDCLYFVIYGNYLYPKEAWSFLPRLWV